MLAIFPDFKMKMRAGGFAGIAYSAYNLALLYSLTGLHINAI